jgi:hypothetical protein
MRLVQHEGTRRGRRDADRVRAVLHRRPQTGGLRCTANRALARGLECRVKYRFDNTRLR